MKKIVKENIPLERYTMSYDEAVAFFKEKDEPYKIELTEKHAGEDISFYSQGEFVDLCAGPHVTYTSAVKAFKLTSVAGAYWRGSEKNKMLSRIYGISFPKKAELEAYLEAVEDAKRRDHNVLGRQLKFFCNSDYVGQGLPLLMPKGAKLFQILNRYVQDKEEYEYYCELPDMIEVYRGVAVGRAKEDGLSWTCNRKTAEWFANRFNYSDNKGYIIKGVIDKADVFAYFNGRNEDEICCNSSKVRDIQKITFSN